MAHISLGNSLSSSELRVQTIYPTKVEFKQPLMDITTYFVLLTSTDELLNITCDLTLLP